MLDYVKQLRSQLREMNMMADQDVRPALDSRQFRRVLDTARSGSASQRFTQE